MPPKQKPVRITTGIIHSVIQNVPYSPRPQITARIARPDNRLLDVAQVSSPNITSSSVIGAFRIASQVRCTCIREKLEYSTSNVAAFIVLYAIVPAARNVMYDAPPTLGSKLPRPNPRPSMYSIGSARLPRIDGIASFFHTR